MENCKCKHKIVIRIHPYYYVESLQRYNIDVEQDVLKNLADNEIIDYKDIWCEPDKVGIMKSTMESRGYKVEIIEH